MPVTRAAHAVAGESGEAALLPVIERLIERLSCVGEARQIGSGLAQALAASAQALDRIGPLALAAIRTVVIVTIGPFRAITPFTAFGTIVVVAILAFRAIAALRAPFFPALAPLAAPLDAPLDALVGKLAQRVFDRRPEFLLLGAEAQAGLEGRDARGGVGVHIVGVHARVMPALAVVAGIGLVRERGTADENDRGRRDDQGFPHGSRPFQ